MAAGKAEQLARLVEEFYRARGFEVHTEVKKDAEWGLKHPNEFKNDVSISQEERKNNV